MKIVIALLAALVLTGCGEKAPATPSPQNAVFAAKNTYQAALIVAVRYNELPRCGRPTSPPVCSDQSAVDVIRKANNSASSALDVAEDVVRNPAFADATKADSADAAVKAVSAMQAIITVYTKKGS